MVSNEATFIGPKYDTDIDFQELSAVNKELGDCLSITKGRFDWKDGEHLRALTKALLLRDFNIEIHIPSNRLCPPIPIRWLYVQWIQSLLESVLPPHHVAQIIGLDIGVGASCIYPLLACSSQPNYTMYGTEIDEVNYTHAIHNVSLNSLSHRIKLFKTTSDSDPLLSLERLQVERLDFTMCNPPFFASKDEVLATQTKETGSPHSTCTGSDVEMITPGGEVAYVSRMIEESLTLRERVGWYTAQLGKLSSLQMLVAKLRDVGCGNWVIRVLRPRGQTVRWALGWSWGLRRADDEVGRDVSLVGKGVMMEPNELDVVPCEGWEDTITRLPMYCAWMKDGAVMVVGTDGAVWSRSARRKRKREGTPVSEAPNADINGQISPEDKAYIFTITLKAEEVTVRIRLVKGADRSVFESFCGMLRAKPTNVKESV